MYKIIKTEASKIFQYYIIILGSISIISGMILGTLRLFIGKTSPGSQIYNNFLSKWIESTMILKSSFFLASIVYMIAFFVISLLISLVLSIITLNIKKKINK